MQFSTVSIRQWFEQVSLGHGPPFCDLPGKRYQAAERGSQSQRWRKRQYIERDMINYFRCTVEHQLYSETLKFGFNVLAAGYNSIKIQMPCIKVRFLITPQELHNRKQAASRTPARISEHQQHRGQIWRMQWGRNSNLPLQASLLITWWDQWKLLLSEMCVFNGKSVYEKKPSQEVPQRLLFSWKAQGLWELPLGHCVQTVHGRRRLKRGLSSSAMMPWDSAALSMDMIFLT